MASPARDDPAVTLRRLLPEPAGAVTIESVYGEAARPRPPQRPWVMVTMIASVDGATAIDARSGRLGNANDRAVLAATRAAADVIIVGATTVRIEGYRPPESHKRIGVVTASGNVDTTTALFTSGAGFLITPELPDAGAPVLPDSVDVVRAGHGRVDLAAAMAGVEALVGPVEVVQAEGGPTLNAALLAADLVDELNLTIAPMLVGGSSLRAVAGGGGEARPVQLADVLVDDDSYLFTRWTAPR